MHHTTSVCGTPCGRADSAWRAALQHTVLKLTKTRPWAENTRRDRFEASQRLSLCAPAEPRIRCTFLDNRLLGSRHVFLPVLLQRKGFRGNSIEVGVWKGSYSRHLLKVWRNGRNHTLVDPYRRFSAGCNMSGGWLKADKQCSLEQATFDHVYNSTRTKFEVEFPQRVRLWRQFSVEASHHVASSSLSFVYIDARHDYDGALADLHAWWPKLCDGAVFAGHDWGHNFGAGAPVATAVRDFVRSLTHTEQARRWMFEPVEFFVTSEHPASWAIIKPPAPCIVPNASG